MKTVQRKDAGTHFSMCVQPAFIIGTSNEDGSSNFAPITWVSVTCEKDAAACAVGKGTVLNVPVLDASRWIYECEVAQSVDIGLSTTFFCRIRNVQMDEQISCRDTFDVDLTKLDPVIYSGMYHSIGQQLGKIGDFLK